MMRDFKVRGLCFCLSSSWPCFSQYWRELKKVAIFQVPSSQRKRESSKFQKSLGFANTHNDRTHPQQFGKKLNWFSPRIQEPYLFFFFWPRRNLITTCQLSYICRLQQTNNQIRHELNQRKRWNFQLHQYKGRKVRLIWDDSFEWHGKLVAKISLHLYRSTLVLRFWSSQQWPVPLKLGLDHCSRAGDGDWTLNQVFALGTFFFFAPSWTVE